MFGYRRYPFNRAMEMLSAIRADPGDLESLFSLQKLLISEITMAEVLINKNKKRQKSNV